MKAVTKLDNTIVENPNGIKDLSQELFYDDELKGIFYRVDGDLEFHSDGYDYIENAILNQGICTSIEFLLQVGTDSLIDYFEGIIHIIDVNRWNASREVIKTPIADNNLSSYIFNNKNVKAYINAPKSKSGFVATPAALIGSFSFFTPSTGVYNYTRDNVYTVDEAFRFLVDFCSDGQMTYSSPYFGSGGDKEGICIASALHLANDSPDVHPYLSFYELFTNLDKIYNLSIRIDYSGALPELIIDKTENLYTATNLYTFTNVKDVEIYFDKEKMYGSIDIGSETWQAYNAGTFNMPDANFIGFQDEKYYIIGQCNIDRTLNLINDFIIDSNTIEDMLVNANDSNDETVVIIETDYPATSQATAYDNIIPSSGKVYNLGFNNLNKSINQLGAIPNDMVLYISNDANNFTAEKNTTYAVTTAKIIHNTETSDPGANYDPVLGRFTCPVAAEGSYSFTFSYTGLNYSGTLGTNAGSITLRHYDSGAVLLATQTILDFTHNIVVIDFGGATGAFNLSAGDYVEVWGVAGLTSTTYFSSSDFSGNYIDAEGGTYQTYDPNDYKVFNIEFDYPLTKTQFFNIRDNITQSITVESGKKTFTGWVKNIKRNIITGISKITLRASNRDNQRRNITR